MSEVEPGAGPSPYQGDAEPRGAAAVPRKPGSAPRKPAAVPVEARAFQGQRAGVVTRTAANTVDFLLVLVLLACGYAAWSAVSFLVTPVKFNFPAPSFMALLICFEIVLITYFTVSWATSGRTYGDHQLGLRVVSFRGGPLRWPGAFIRAVFCSLVPIGLYWAVLSPTNRSVQDGVLRTSVIYDWTVRREPAPRITRPG